MQTDSSWQAGISDTPQEVPKLQPRRWLWLVAGFANIGLGIVGALLPVMPSTVFAIAAAACFAKSSPRLEQKVLDHPTMGPAVRAWRETGAIPMRGKIAAISGMSFSMVLVLLQGNLNITLIVATLMIGSGWFVLSRPTSTSGSVPAEGPRGHRP
jgi:hypothetical protein